MSEFLAGAGRGTIRFPEEMLPTPEGYDRIHDLPCARVLLLEKSGTRFAFVHLELNNVFESGAEQLIRLTAERTGTDPDRIFFHCVHVLETPHPAPPFRKDEEAERFNAMFFGAVRTAVEEACGQALAALRPARFGAGKTVCASCIVSRNIETRDGWWLGSGETEPSDKEVPVLRFEDEEGTPIAVLFVCHAQSSVMDGSRAADGGRYITADLAGASASFIESQFPGCVAMYCTGAGGDGCPSFQARRNVLGADGTWWTEDIHEEGFLLVRLLGERLGSAVVQEAGRIPCRIPAGLRADIYPVEFEGRARVPLDRIRPGMEINMTGNGSRCVMEPACLVLGDQAVIVGLQAEICARTELALKAGSPYPVTGVMTFSQLGLHPGQNMGKYMGERLLYERRAFQAMNSGVVEGSAEKLLEHMIDKLKKGGQKTMHEAFLFDLDGVLVDTAKYHFLAWRALAEELGIDFTEKDNERLKGVSRMQSLEIILEIGGVSLSDEEKDRACERKNETYLSYIRKMGTDEILPGAKEFLEDARKEGYKIALGSASKNTPLILERLELTSLFDAVVDGRMTTRAKPDPEVFSLGAELLGVAPEKCVVFEDAAAGIRAAHAAGMQAVGIGTAEALPEADILLPGFAGITVRDVEERLNGSRK